VSSGIEADEWPEFAYCSTSTTAFTVGTDVISSNSVADVFLSLGLCIDAALYK
jgi:hypothetical protein